MDIIIQDLPQLYSPQLEEFYAYPPYSHEAKNQAKAAVLAKTYPRREISEALFEYNESIGSDQHAIENIFKLKDPQTVCVVTGQQLGFMGGPAYTILKAISCLLLAKSLNAVPIFWLATEDHDLHEIDHTYLLDSIGNLKEFKLSIPKKNIAVEDFLLTAAQRPIIQDFLKEASLPQVSIFTESYSAVMAAYLAVLFRGTGLVFLEPKILKKLGGSFFLKELEEAKALFKVLQETTKKLGEKGGLAPLIIKEGPQLFFKADDGVRQRVEGKASLNELKKILEQSPERFSTNAASRPVFQSLVLPTVAYVAGPQELNYYRQLKDYHEFHSVPMPWIVPRLSATVITPEANEFMQKLNLKPWDELPSHWVEALPGLKWELDRLKGEWGESAIRLFPNDLHPKSLERDMRHFIDKMQKEIIANKLKKKQIPSFALHYLRNLIHPHNQLQERVLNWAAFQAVSKENLIQTCLSRLTWDIKGHIFLFI